jgi:formylmethanofuran dehydrogenase subunit B
VNKDKEVKTVCYTPAPTTAPTTAPATKVITLKPAGNAARADNHETDTVGLDSKLVAALQTVLQFARQSAPSTVTGITAAELQEIADYIVKLADLAEAQSRQLH